MSKALSVDLRSSVVAAVKAGASHREAAARFGVSAASESRWRRLEREHGDVHPGPYGGDRRSCRGEAQAELIRSLLEETGDITIDELPAALAQRGNSFGCNTIHRFLKRRAITRKNRPRGRAGPPGRPEPPARQVRCPARCRPGALGVHR